jgi:hypothetical protein
MALLTPVAYPSGNANANIVVPPLSGDLYAGEALLAVAPCYIKAADGKVYMSNGTAANEAASFDGFTPRAYAAGEAVTLLGIGAQFGYSSGLTPGARYYIGATAGRLDTAATTGDAVGVAKAINATDIRVIRAA